MSKFRNIFQSIDRLSDNAATVIAAGSEDSLALTIAAMLMVDADFFAALETASVGIKLLSAAVAVSLIWYLSVNRSGNKNDTT